MVKYCDKLNLVIKLQKGKVLFWYNYLYDGICRWLGELDFLLYYGSCYVQKGEKWVVKIWVNINGDGKEEFRVWKMGYNWLVRNNYKKEIVNVLYFEIYEKIGVENKYIRDMNKNIVMDVKNEDFLKEDVYIVKEENIKLGVN